MDGLTPETCAECGFDASQWRLRDAGTIFEALGYWWRLAMTGVDEAELNRRPAPGVWSALEYGLHSAMVAAVIRSGVEMILGGEVELPEPPAGGSGEDAAAVLDVQEVLDALEREGAAFGGILRQRGSDWSRTARLPGRSIVQAEALVLHAAHDLSHHFMDVGRGLAPAFGDLGTGRVSRINVSGGGVPKQAVPRAEVAWGGLLSDRQADRKHHGRPFQAVCLWSAEVIAELAGAGHPIGPGAAGENLTVAGLDWPSMRSGLRLTVGELLLELSFPAIPCHKQARWFSDGDFTRINHDNNPQWARWYAWVRRPGSVETGDAVTVSA